MEFVCIYSNKEAKGLKEDLSLKFINLLRPSTQQSTSIKHIVFKLVMCVGIFFFFFFLIFGGHMSFFGATGTPVLDFW